MRILLLNTPAREQKVVRDMAGGLGFDGGGSVVLPPLELAYMAATLLRKGHQVRLIDPDAENHTQADVFRMVEAFKPDAAIATVSLPTLYRDCAFIAELRAHLPGKIFAKTSIAYAGILKEIVAKSAADACIFGECELNIEGVVEGQERKGTAYMHAGEFKVEENSLIADLDALPLPARQLLPNDKYTYILLGDKATTMQTSRGCPYPCAYYCGYPLVQGRKWRARSPEHVILEIEDIVRNHGIRKILFRDATFTLNKSRTHRICDLIIENKLEISWWCETRVDCLDEDLMGKMRSAGCLGMNIGVESGDPQVLEAQAKIGLTLEKLGAIRNTARELGLKLHFLLMIGLPDETKRSLYATYRLLDDLKPESMGVCIVTPYPGTPLYEEAAAKGWIESEDWTKFGGHTAVMHTDDLSVEDLKKTQGMLQRGFALRSSKNPLNRLRLWALNRQFRKWCFSDPKLSGSSATD
jgi:radical SAM superfamily enzyme YgiQ (UPF0313 family)